MSHPFSLTLESTHCGVTDHVHMTWSNVLTAGHIHTMHTAHTHSFVMESNQGFKTQPAQILILLNIYVLNVRNEQKENICYRVAKI